MEFRASIQPNSLDGLEMWILENVSSQGLWWDSGALCKENSCVLGTAMELFVIFFFN